jgi:hypothetical protein
MSTRTQDIYAGIVVDIAKVLKPRGFLKRGDRFGQRRGDDWAVVDLQKHSSATTKDNIRFAINLGVWFRDLEDAPQKSPPSIADCHWWDRVRDEPPEDSERWWIIDYESDSELLSKVVLQALEAALPKLDAVNEAEVLERFRAGKKAQLRIGRRHEARIRELLASRPG